MISPASTPYQRSTLATRATAAWSIPRRRMIASATRTPNRPKISRWWSTARTRSNITRRPFSCGPARLAEQVVPTLVDVGRRRRREGLDPSTQQEQRRFRPPVLDGAVGIDPPRRLARGEGGAVVDAQVEVAAQLDEITQRAHVDVGSRPPVLGQGRGLGHPA